MASQELKDYRVYKSNQLIEASYRLNLEEQRLILASIAQIDSRTDSYQTIVKVTAKDYSDTYNLDIKTTYQQLKSATDRLYERDIRTYDPETGAETRMRWVSSVKYQNKQGYVVLAFSPEIKGFLFELTERFTSYRLRSVANLRSIYAIRIFEMLEQYRRVNRPGRRIELADFRRRLVIEDKYPRFADLRKRVLEPAIKELNANANIIVRYDPIKEGRNIVALMLYSEDNPQAALNL